MKNLLKTKILWITCIILLLLSTSCIASNIALDSSDNSNNELNVEESYELISSDLYKFDKDIVINDIVDGNIFAFGNNVKISGEIGGDVFVCANNVEFTDNAYIHGSIFVCSQTCTMSGISYDIYAVCENLTLEKTSIVARDIRVSSSNINIYGSVKRDAYISANTLNFAEGASHLIGGNLNYSSNSEFSFSEDLVDGSINFTPNVKKEASFEEKISSYINKILSGILYSLAIVLLCIWLTPKFSEKAGTILKKKAPLSFGIGLLSSVVIISASILLLLITYGLGSGISFAAITIYILCLTITQTVFSMALANILSNKFNLNKKFQFVLLTLLVSFIIGLLKIVPYVGIILSFVVSMLGLGILVYNLISKKTLNEINT